MACGLDEVEACMDTVIDELLSVHAVFLLEVGIEARFNIFDDRLPTVQERDM